MGCLPGGRTRPLAAGLSQAPRRTHRRVQLRGPLSWSCVKFRRAPVDGQAFSLPTHIAHGGSLAQASRRCDPVPPPGSSQWAPRAPLHTPARGPRRAPQEPSQGPPGAPRRAPARSPGPSSHGASGACNLRVRPQSPADRARGVVSPVRRRLCGGGNVAILWCVTRGVLGQRLVTCLVALRHCAADCAARPTPLPKHARWRSSCPGHRVRRGAGAALPWRRHRRRCPSGGRAGPAQDHR